MSLSDDLFHALHRVAEDLNDHDPDFVERAKSRLDVLEPHQQVAFEMSRYLAQQSVAHTDKRLHFASMAALFLSGILEEEPGFDHLSLADFMDFAEAGWADIEAAIDAAVALLWEDGASGPGEAGA